MLLHSVIPHARGTISELPSSVGEGRRAGLRGGAALNLYRSCRSFQPLPQAMESPSPPLVYIRCNDYWMLKKLVRFTCSLQKLRKLAKIRSVHMAQSVTVIFVNGAVQILQGL